MGRRRFMYRPYTKSRNRSRYQSRPRAPQKSQFQLELERCPPSGSTAYVFPYSAANKTYNMASYNEELSSGRITREDCQYFVNEITKVAPSNGPESWLWIITCFNLITAAACFIALLVTTSKNYPKDAKEISRDNLIGGLIIGVGGLIVVIGLFLFQTNLISSIFRKRQLTASAAIKYLNNNRFEGREVILSRSYHGAYIAIQFNWMQVTPAMETLHARNQDLHNYEPEIMPESNEKNDVNVGIGPLAAPQA